MCTDIQRSLLRPRDGERMVPVHYQYTSTRPHSCHIPGDSSLKWLLIWEPLLVLLLLFGNITALCEIYRCVCSALATSINWYGSAKTDICIGPFHTVHYFLLLVCLLQWNTDFTFLESLVSVILCKCCQDFH